MRTFLQQIIVGFEYRATPSGKVQGIDQLNSSGILPIDCPVAICVKQGWSFSQMKLRAEAPASATHHPHYGPGDKAAQNEGQTDQDYGAQLAIGPVLALRVVSFAPVATIRIACDARRISMTPSTSRTALLHQSCILRVNRASVRLCCNNCSSWYGSRSQDCVYNWCASRHRLQLGLWRVEECPAA